MGSQFLCRDESQEQVPVIIVVYSCYRIIKKLLNKIYVSFDKKFETRNQFLENDVFAVVARFCCQCR